LFVALPRQLVELSLEILRRLAEFDGGLLPGLRQCLGVGLEGGLDLKLVLFCLRGMGGAQFPDFLLQVLELDAGIVAAQQECARGVNGIVIVECDVEAEGSKGRDTFFTAAITRVERLHATTDDDRGKGLQVFGGGFGDQVQNLARGIENQQVIIAVVEMEAFDDLVQCAGGYEDFAVDAKVGRCFSRSPGTLRLL
jgi:hypothetical protein